MMRRFVGVFLIFISLPMIWFMGVQGKSWQESKTLIEELFLKGGKVSES